MDFNLSEEHISIQKLAAEFAENEISPHAAQWDEKHIFPEECLRKASQLGFNAIYTHTKDGGSGLSRLHGILIFQELAKYCPSTAAFLSIQNMVIWMISNYANEYLKNKFLPDLISAHTFASYCLTEPNSGSDAASLQTTAKLVDDYFILNGSKAFISGGSKANIYLCMAKTQQSTKNSDDISCFLLTKDMPGISFGNPEKKLGWHNQPTTMIFLENCKVPKQHLVGKLHNGFNIALNALNGGRINIAACSIGGAEFCLQKTLFYCQERTQFNKKLQDFQSIQFKLANMKIMLETAKLANLKAATSVDNNESDLIMQCAIAKKYITDSCFNIVNNCLQIHGGYGYLQDYAIERYFRDLRVHQILEGTNEIMQKIIFNCMQSSN